MIAPRAADPQVAVRDADALEAVLLQHPMGSEVVDAYGRLNSVQSEIGTCELGDGGDRLAREPAAVPIAIDPLAQPCRLGCATDDVLEPNQAGDLRLRVEDHIAKQRAGAVRERGVQAVRPGACSPEGLLRAR